MVLRLVEQAEWHLIGTDWTAWLHILDLELDNIRAALAWCLTEDGDLAIGQRMVGSLGRFWYFRGRLHEGRMWAELMQGDVSAAHASKPLKKRVRKDRH
jgi:predicted ATPase